MRSHRPIDISHFDSGQPQPRGFATTQWSLVLAGRKTGEGGAQAALEHLCSAYWYPVYAFVRRKGHRPDDTGDLTQQFFIELLARRFLESADPARGRFRSFLLTALERFLINESTKKRRLKRGGGRSSFSLDAERAEERYDLEPADPITPERLYERRWALTLLERALSRLAVECAASGRTALFDEVEGILAGKEDRSYLTIASRLGMSEGAVKTAVHRLRRRYGEILRAEISETVTDSEDVDDEVRHLFTVLA